MHSKNLPGLKPALTLADAVVVAALCRSPPYVAAGMVLNRCFWYGSEPAATAAVWENLTIPPKEAFFQARLLQLLLSRSTH
jgi:hypothetical protein